MTPLNPIVSVIVLVVFTIFFLSFLLRIFKLPSVITYILVGIALGPSVLGLIQNSTIITFLGDIGVILLLFFIGMSISFKELKENWKIAVVGTILQVILSVIFAAIVGDYLGWPITRSILIGFVISLSSTAVVLKILESRNEVHSKVGQSTLGILIIQDLVALPMIIILSLVGAPENITAKGLFLQIFGVIFLVGVVTFAIIKNPIKLKFLEYSKKDTELQIFGALGVCFGFAFIAEIFGLSSALGAFVAGILVSSTHEAKWIKNSLSPFYVVFVALFFVSIGLLIDIPFIITNWKIITFLTFSSFAINILINATSLRLLGLNLADSVYSALLLSHIGEFSYVLVAIGIASGFISEYGYNLTISVISLSLLITPLIISIYRLFF